MPNRRLAHIGATMAICTVPMVTAADANPVLLFEPATGQVLYAEEPDRLWYPASVTKLMTAYLTFDAVKTGRLAWDDDVPLSDHARAQPATRIGLRAGIKMNVEQAVRGLILRSANDFAVALAERVGGTEEAFVLAMNDTAKRLGMSRTVFRNPHGLPDEAQVTTARDLATLTTALYRDFPDRAEVFSTQDVRIHKGTFHSQNDLLRTLEGADGMKTGFTCASGYNVVASATRDGHRLVAIVLGEYNRQRRSTRATDLIESGFAHLSADPDLKVAVAVPSAAPFKLRHAAASVVAAQPFMPVTLRSMATSPAEAVPPGNVGRDVRTPTCRGYSGFAKPEAEHEPEDAPEHVETSAVTRPVARRIAPTNAVSVTGSAKPNPTAAPRAAVHRKPTPVTDRVSERTTIARKPTKARSAAKMDTDVERGAASAMHQSPSDRALTFGN